MKYIKKPVIIEAVLWTGNNHREMFEFLGGNPDDYIQPSGKNFYINHNKVKGGLIIKTLEGEHIARIGDFIIKGVEGEYYPCKPAIFTKTYMIEADSKPLDIKAQLRLMRDKCPDVWKELNRLPKGRFCHYNFIKTGVQNCLHPYCKCCWDKALEGDK